MGISDWNDLQPSRTVRPDNASRAKLLALSIARNALAALRIKTTDTSALLLDQNHDVRIVGGTSRERAMQLHLDRDSESRICLAAIVVLMVLTASAILYMGARYHTPAHTLARVPLATPL